MALGRAYSVAIRGLDGVMVEIEADITSGLPGVHLVGLPDAEMGESVAVAIETAQGVPLDETLRSDLEAYCRSRLAGYKCPRTWLAVDRLPRNEIGKVPKQAVRELFIAAG